MRKATLLLSPTFRASSGESALSKILWLWEQASISCASTLEPHVFPFVGFVLAPIFVRTLQRQHFTQFLKLGFSRAGRHSVLRLVDVSTNGMRR